MKEKIKIILINKNINEELSSDLVLRKGFKYACDIPKRVSNIINPVQRRVIC